VTQAGERAAAGSATGRPEPAARQRPRGPAAGRPRGRARNQPEGRARRRAAGPGRIVRRGRWRVRFGRAAVPWLFLAPAAVIFVYFKFIPMAQAMWMSLYEVRPYLGNRFVGARNYAEVAGSPDFQAAIWHTVVLATGQTVGSMVLGFVLALLLERQSRRIWLVRTAVFLPVVVATAVLVEVWRILYYPAPDGTLNSMAGWVGLGPSAYLSDPDTALGSVLAAQIWRQAPYDMMIFLAGLAGVDRTLYEAAAVDGAGRVRRLVHITLPALRPVFAILFLLAAIRGLRVFTEVYLLTNGGPGGATEVLMTLIYKFGLERNELGIASAGSVILFAATVALTVLVQLLRRRRRELGVR
jgi:multiple sugar transport system permease protein